jgi:hypothetical protein
VVHAYNPNYYEAEIGGLQLETSPCKMLVRPCFKNKSGVVAQACNSVFLGGGGRRIRTGQKHETLSEKQSKSKGLGCGSSGRVLT